ncbi:hypothetical protein [Halanaerobaculum tunisiense]
MNQDEFEYYLKDINQANDSEVDVTQKNIVIFYFDSSSSSVPDLEPLEEIIGEELNLIIDEQGKVIFNEQEIEVKELEEGAKAFVLEEEEVKTTGNN